MNRNRLTEVGAVFLAQAVLLLLGLLTTYLPWRLAMMALAALLSILAWQRYLGRRRALENTPESPIASTAQGLAVLAGRARVHGELQRTPSGVDCVWFRCVHARAMGKDVYNRRQWRIVRRWQTTEPFLIADERGACLIDPAQAEFDLPEPEQHIRGDDCFLEWAIMERTALHAFGRFSSELPDRHSPQAVRAAVSERLSDWKSDRVDLLRRFDADGNGEIDVQEWEQARTAAAREVETERIRAAAAEATHTLGKPAGLPLIVSTRELALLGQRYRRIARWFLLSTFAILLGMWWFYHDAARQHHRRPVVHQSAQVHDVSVPRLA
ncbi:EF-hand domain-containing protein [Andreprevotia lacus]|nr:EF-hand domain-containing protein [Andreprevotia lacus]